MLDLVRENAPGDRVRDAALQDDEVTAGDVEAVRGAEGLFLNAEAEFFGVLPRVVRYGVTSSGLISTTVSDGFAAASHSWMA